MALFAVLAPLDNAKIGPVLEETFAGNYQRVWNGQWFVSAQGTTKDICDQLGISDGTNGTGIVVAVASYWGRASADLWPWLGEKLQPK
jgi:hypothetical protein